MAVIWIVTTGNSDVKLSSDHQWCRLREQKVDQLKPCYRDFKSPEQVEDQLFLLPARVMGIVYGDALDTHWKYLLFPLLTEFVKEIKADKKNKPDRIIVLLTNQAKIFLENNSSDQMYDRSDPDCPFWKDTTELKPIFKRFFDDNFGSNKAEFYSLEPKTIQEGLDNWDSTLRLVQGEFENWGISKGDRVIVSHQAGTPAISSAIQLTALIKFGKKVSFLVGNEFIKDDAKFLPASSYFDTLQIQEAQQLLKRFDYSGVRRALDKIDIKEPEKQIRLNHLLEISELWNAAKFEEFSKKLGGAATSRSNTWWWKGYEMAYLAWIRMFQENSTEALFHSVRAIEGLICEWAIKTHSTDIHYKFLSIDRNGNRRNDYHSNRFRNGKEGSPTAKRTIDNNFTSQLYDNQKETLNKDKLGLHGQTLYSLFRATFKSSHISNLETHSISIVWDQLADKRNDLFHRLKGISEDEVYDAWGCKNDRNKWGEILFDCVQLVSDTHAEGFKSLKQGSLMTSVHQDLELEINLLLQNRESANKKS
jgi:hypothetical protein